jgi:heptaprenyl diphosphate synthase
MAVTAICTEASADVQRRLREIARHLVDCAGPHGAADRAMAEAVTGFLDRIEARGSQPAVDGIIALPLLVHGAYTGNPRPAAPAAVAHMLWWVTARYLDDLTDAGERTDKGDSASGLLAVVGIACHLCAEVLDAACPDDPARALYLRRELSRSWHSALSGQLADLTADPTTATCDEVLASYRGKTGAPYAMSAAMGAIFAGCDTELVDAWRGFGERFGVLRQLLNDQRDLASGRNEDLRNHTATYLMVHFLRSLPESERATARALLAECAESATARAQLAEWLTDPTQLHSLAASVRPLIDELHTSIDDLTEAPEFASGLHDLVHDTVNLYPEFLLGSERALR